MYFDCKVTNYFVNAQIFCQKTCVFQKKTVPLCTFFVYRCLFGSLASLVHGCIYRWYMKDYIRIVAVSF